MLSLKIVQHRIRNHYVHDVIEYEWNRQAQTLSVTFRNFSGKESFNFFHDVTDVAEIAAN